MTDARIRDVDASARIDDGKIRVVDNGKATIYVDMPDVEPLAPEQRHATLRVVGEDFQAAVDLDAEGLDALADAVDGSSTEVHES